MRHSPQQVAGVSQKNEALAVLVLPPPPENRDPKNWYRHHIAGVPFVLRNILNLQRGGVRNLIVFQKNNASSSNWIETLLKDPRLTLEPSWVSDSGQLVRMAETAPKTLIVDGSHLHDKVRVHTALTSSPENGKRKGNVLHPLDRNELEAWLQGSPESAENREGTQGEIQGKFFFTRREPWR